MFIITFNSCHKHHMRSDKAPDAMLELGGIFCKKRYSLSHALLQQYLGNLTRLFVAYKVLFHVGTDLIEFGSDLVSVQIFYKICEFAKCISLPQITIDQIPFANTFPYIYRRFMDSFESNEKVDTLWHKLRAYLRARKCMNHKHLFTLCWSIHKCCISMYNEQH